MNIYEDWVPKGEKKLGIKRFEEITAENSLIWGNVWIYRFKNFSDPETRYKKGHKRYIIKLLKSKDNEKNLESSQRKITYYI